MINALVHLLGEGAYSVAICPLDCAHAYVQGGGLVGWWLNDSKKWRG